MAIRIRTVRNTDELAAALGAIGHYFGWQPTAEQVELWLSYLPLDRVHAALDGGVTVGGAGVFPFEMTVPGGPVPCAGVTVVGVHPTHRRRGILRRMMTAQLEDVRERGEPIASLWASEDTIYGRYGYGPAARRLDAKMDKVWIDLRPGLPAREGQVRLVDQDEARKIIPRLYEGIRRRTTGFIRRTPDWWQNRFFDDPDWRRGGAGPLNRALLELDGRPAGYALYRIYQYPTEWKRSLRVVEAMGVDARATREIWRFLLGVDWMDEIEMRMLPVDHPIWHLVSRPRYLGTKLTDGPWIRPIDVGAALSARSYAGDGRVTLEVVSDPLFPDNVGVWTIADGVAKRSSRRPDVRLNVQALGSVYLGGFSFAELARGELLEEAARAGIARADAMFRTDAAPWCPEIF
jgi:predicted acetyltransferase